MATQRKIELSMLNTLLCLIVILIHINSYAVVGYEKGSTGYFITVLVARFSAFVVQGFVLLAGVKAFLGNKERKYTVHLKNRLKGVLLPYVVAFIGYYVFYMLFYNYPLNFAFISKHFLLGTLTYHLYFVPIIVQFDILLSLWKRIVSRYSPIIVIPISLLLSSFFEMSMSPMISAIFENINFAYNDRLFTTYFAYYLIGCYIGKYYEQFTTLINKSFGAITVITAFTTVLNGFFTCLKYDVYGNIEPFLRQLHFIYVVTMVIFLFALALRLPKGFFEKSTLLNLIDKVSYNIYLWHVLVLSFMNYIISYLAIQSQAICYLVRFVGVYSITISGCILFYKVKNFILKRQ